MIDDLSPFYVGSLGLGFWAHLKPLSKKGEPMGKFWLTFVINEALSVLGAYIASTNLTPAQKGAAEKLLADGTAFLATL